MVSCRVYVLRMLGSCPDGKTQCVWFGAGGCQPGVCAVAASRRADGGLVNGFVSHELLGIAPPLEATSLEALTGVATEPLK